MSFRKPPINNPYSKLQDNTNIVSSKINNDSRASIDFFSIVLSGDVTKLDSFINNNSFNVNALNKDRVNALHIILESELPELTKLNIIKYLITKKIFTEVKNKIGTCFN